MACLKSQNELSSDADDFLSKFLNFVQQNKEENSLIDNQIPILTGADALSKERDTTTGEFPLDIGIPSIEVSLPDDATSMVNDDICKVDFLQDNANNAVIDILSENSNTSPNNRDITFNHLFQQRKCQNNNTSLTYAIESRIDDVISQSVSAELQKVLADPCAFEDIELYLECSEDDIQTIQQDTVDQNNFASGSFSLHAGNSSVDSDMILKISFPVIEDEIEERKHCSSCKSMFLSTTDLLNHLDLGNCRVLICRECSYNTRSVKRYLTHMERRHNISSANEQMWTNSGTSLYKVKQSIKMVDNDIERQKKHTRSQTMKDALKEDLTSKKVAAYSCDLCKYSGKSSKLLKMHYDNMHNVNRGLYRCHNCPFTCLQKITLESHSKIHQEIFTHRCLVCDKQFISTTSLNRHSKIHRTDRDYVCCLCDKSFKIKSTLTDHTKKVHNINADTGFSNAVKECSDVKKTYQLTLDNISREQIVKSVDKSCGEENNSKSDTLLANTFTADTGDLDYIEKLDNEVDLSKSIQVSQFQNKRFLCTWPNCGKRFRDNYNLNNHLQRHTKVKSLTCSECSFTCIQKSHLQYHFKSKHLGTSVSSSLTQV